MHGRLPYAHFPTKMFHLFYHSHFKTKTSGLCEKKNAVYYIQISLFAPEMFKIFNYAN